VVPVVPLEPLGASLPFAATTAWLPPWLQPAGEFASGPFGLVAVFGYSLLVAVALPFPGELVLAAPLEFGLSREATLGLVILVSAFGKALGSIGALALRNRAARSTTGSRTLDRLAGRLPRRTERRVLGFVREHGYLGLAVLLSVPMFPDTLPVYAFSVIESSYLRFGVAAFAGTVVRLLVVAGVAGAVLSAL
jgi:uncharacterized membrane protein YdjX (TVP38/TMEM64 family)